MKNTRSNIQSKSLISNAISEKNLIMSVWLRIRRPQVRVLLGAPDINRVGGGVTFRRPPTPPYVRFRIRRFMKRRERQSVSRNEDDHDCLPRLAISGPEIL